MKPQQPSSPVSDATRVRAEAAAWIARLHGPDRTPADDKGFQAWLKANPDHARAFEQMTDIWETGARLKSDTLARVREGRRVLPPMPFMRVALASAAFAVVAMISIFFLLSNPSISTGVGEQHIRTLSDGTRITLNTATRLKVRYNDKQRRIELENGEALFEVAKRPDWPFVVSTGGKEVIARGTTFVVRHDAQQTAVTLIEGKVEVLMEEGGTASLDAVQHHETALPTTTPTSTPEMDDAHVILAAGQRVTFLTDAAPKLDAPSLQKITAWKQGLVQLDNTPLADAIAEMNRYSVVPLVLKEPEQIDVRVSGVFRAGDSLEFARAIAQAYGLSFTEESNAFVLSPRTSQI
jgi:transmembrane sensor